MIKYVHITELRCRVASGRTYVFSVYVCVGRVYYMCVAS